MINKNELQIIEHLKNPGSSIEDLNALKKQD